MHLQILKYDLFNEYKDSVKESPMETLRQNERVDIEVDYFKFYNSVSSVYSSKIEGDEIDFDSFYKYKFLNIKYQADYTKKADDLFSAYEFIFQNRLTFDNLKQAHRILSSNLLPKSQQGNVRNNPMFVINNDDRIEYVAAEPAIVDEELQKLFADIDLFLKSDLTDFETFYFAAYIHLVFVKIHPFQDGNGRAARLLEKWFLVDKLGDKATAIQLEKNYYRNLESYYRNIKKLGIEYDALDYSKSLDFLLMTISGLNK